MEERGRRERENQRNSFMRRILPDDVGFEDKGIGQVWNMNSG